jgi:glycosyltransferase involved in cell wall biosynthesis
MRVELVSHLPKGSVSGIGRYVRELQRHLADEIDVTVTHVIDPPLANRFPILHNFPVGVDGHQPGSIVHFTQIMGCAQMLWRPVRPAVATVHDLGVLVCKEDDALFNRSDRRILDLHIAGLKRMDYYAVNSDRTRRGLMEILHVPEERIRFVQLGVDCGHFHPIAQAWSQVAARYGILPMEGVTDLLYVGSELPRKNLGLLLQAMSILKQQSYRVRLLKVGGPGGQRWRQELLADLDRLQLREDVMLVDVVPEDDLPLFYNVADVGVTPTLLEGGFAWLAMEAMACEKPVVATHEALVPAEAQDAALIVESRDPNEMAQAIALCIDEPGRRRAMGQAGRQIIKRYTWEATARSMIEVYALAAQGQNHA